MSLANDPDMKDVKPAGMNIQEVPYSDFHGVIMGR